MFKEHVDLNPYGDNALERKRQRTLSRSEDTQPHNLDFLKEWLTEVGKTPVSASVDAGFSPNTVSSWLKQDTTSLSNIARVMEVQGWQPFFEFKTPGRSEQAWITIPVRYYRTTKDLRPAIKWNYLDFVEQKFAECGLTKTKVAEDMNWSRQMLQYLFKQQDMQIEDVIRMARLYGWTFKVTPIQVPR